MAIQDVDTDKADWQDGWVPEQKITVREALRAYTVHGTGPIRVSAAINQSIRSTNYLQVRTLRSRRTRRVAFAPACWPT